LKLKQNADLFATGLLAIASALVIEYAPYVYVRLAFALLLLFVLPGYGITQALFAESPRSLPQVYLLSVGLSLSVSILTALVLSLATNGLRTGSWLTVVVAIVIAACWVAFRRREWLEPDEPRIALRSGVHVRVRVRDVLLLAIAAVVIAGAVVFAKTPLPAEKVQGYTALSIVQASRTPPTVRVGVASDELQTRLFRVEVRSETKVLYNRRIELVPGQKWSTTARVPSPPPGEQARVEAAIYWNYQPKKQYRSVHIWVGGGEARR
jgi:uncharacterized membrane protein